MTHEEKISYMKVAAGICGFGFRYDQIDLLVSLYELVIEKGGDADLRSCTRIESEVKARADKKHREDLLDKVSEKA